MRALEHRYLEALTYVGGYDDVSDSFHPETSATSDKIELRKLIHFLPFDELSLLLLRDMGYKPKEISTIMRLSSMWKYYRIRRDLEIHMFLYTILSISSKEDLP